MVTYIANWHQIVASGDPRKSCMWHCQFGAHNAIVRYYPSITDDGWQCLFYANYYNVMLMTLYQQDYLTCLQII